jgi:hypothetical protein
MNIIFAPHVDDEVIGCYSILDKISHVVYFFDIDENRKKEAEKFCSDFNIIPHFSLKTIPTINESITIYAPHSSDKHPHHKYVNQYAKKISYENNAKVIFYSVDMESPNLLPENIHKQKRDVLLKYFTSQKKLLENNDKYHLFERQYLDDDDLFIYITTQHEGFHAYTNAPKEVEYLSLRHRHMFYITCTIQVWHSDREIEFHIVKRWLDSILQGNINDKSCEQIAIDIKNKLHSKYGWNRIVNVKVSEDGENGAIIK